MIAHLCLVEDDRTIRELVAKRLERRGFRVDTFDAAEPLLATKTPGPWDLYIVDLLLPGESGLTLCQHLRRVVPNAPVLILSALAEPRHRVQGLKEGADDYLTKPFEMEELVLRIEGLLKRRHRAPDSGPTEFRWGKCSVDFVRSEGEARGKKFSLSEKERKLMQLLVERRGTVVTREEILDRVWGSDAYPSPRTVDNFLVRLRRQFEIDPKQPRHLHSVRGKGYKFTPEEM